ncbi:hypothetical protein AALO_G00008970 [Alosa alosa]|uniref:NEDD4-binding protein 2 n=1 Tax=Alosa alosa TaxID=278164 RepID=A0AAV6HIZ3_9TELE|nr:NEDD4-binding protein 2 [Alosa alosa]KAG5285916.1 hypothetical protein AALO_G00008970 [Alosa alosa]
MPKKRKSGQSPARVPGQLNESRSNDNRVYGSSEPFPQGEPNRSNSGYGISNSTALGFTDREHILRNMEEVFSHLDPEVIHMVLTECDFNMENAMDSLLELSDAAKGPPTLPPPVSGFEIAAALLNPDLPQSITSHPKTTDSSTLGVHTPHALPHHLQSEPSSLSTSVPLSSLPTPQFPPQQTLLSNPSLHHQTFSPKQKQASRGNSPVGELSFAAGATSVNQSDRLDFSHLIGGSVGLGGSGSAFQAYRRDEQPRAVGAPWNITAPEFHPRVEVPSFITPVVQNPTLAARWSTYASVSQAPLKPTATIPTSWTTQQPPVYGNKPTTAPTPNHRLCFEGRVVVLLRGAPGSGKSTLARALLDHNHGGVSLSTDEYFCRHGDYCYDPSELGTAHEWNQQRAKEAMERGQSPVIIDNTNLQSWEMRPYVAMALKQKYKVVFREPDTWWKFKPRELEKHTKHGVNREKIRRMLDSYDKHVSVNSIMGSARLDLHREPPVTSDLPRPDLLEPPPPVSLPDVSSVPVRSFFMGQPPELLDSVDLYQDPQDVDQRLHVELPVMFSQSIGQRERKERDRGRRPANSQPAAALSSAAAQGFVEADCATGSDEEIFAAGSAEVQAEVAKGGDAQGAPLTFIGDWPCESQGPRGQRTSNRRLGDKEAHGQDDAGGAEVRRAGGGPDFSEFQKLMDLLQGDAEVDGPIELSDSEEESSPSSGPDTQPPSPSCLTEDTTHVPNPSREEERTGAEKGEEDRAQESGEESNKEEEEMEKDRKDEGKEIKEGKDGLEEVSDAKGLEGREDGERSGGGHVSEKRRVNRRSGKSCRLALTFTNQAPASVSPHHTQTESPLQPECQTQDTSIEVVPSCSISTQTESCDFALLWRLEHGGLWEGAGEKVLTGNASHFVPAVSEAESACLGRRVTHDRGAQVEEEELMEARTKDEGLSILMRHFTGVAVETLNDLYEKCQQDLEWTTNLLLDSGERLSREDEEAETEDEDELGRLKEGEREKAEEKDEAEREKIKDSEREEVKAVGIGITESTREDTEADVRSRDPADVRVSRPDEATDGTHVRSEVDEDEAQPTRDSKSPPEPFAHEPTAQATMTSQSQEAVQQQESSQSQRHLSEFAGTGTYLFLDACPEASGWTVGFQEEEDGGVEGDGKEDMRRRVEDVDAVTQSILSHLEKLTKREEDEKEREKQERERERRKERTKGSKPLDIQTLELKLPTELALQLTELFGPVGINPGEFSDDCSVKMDLNLARLLHQKWKETIQEKQRQASLSYHLLQESSVHWGESQSGMSRPQDGTKPHFLIGVDGYASLVGQSDYTEDTPIVANQITLKTLQHRNLSQPYVSLRDIMSEEQALQDIEKSRLSHWDPELRDGAAMLKEKQLFSLFPTIDRLFLKDIFRHNSYSLEQTEKYLHCLLDVGPVKNVVATDSGPQHNHTHTPRTPSKERKQQEPEPVFQETDEPEYQDLRAEANLHRFKQQECFSKAAEAHRRGKRQVASFYAQQGHLHGQKMREANHRAALCIFERVNASLLPQNVLDLHGLHVSEALEHLQRILKVKSTEYKQGLCKPQLSVITGRGNRSQGGVAKIRPAVIDYLKSKHYEFTEPNGGLVLVSLQKEVKA